MKKKIILCLLSGILGVSLLTGCSSKINEDATVVTVGKNEVTLGEANFYARMTQAQWETYYSSYLGEEMWKQEAEEGVTYEESVKKDILTQLEQMAVLKDHAEEEGVGISEEESTKIKEAAKAFVKANKEDDLEKVSGSTKSVESVLEMLTLNQKMSTVIGNKADTEVSDEEAAQKSMDYVSFPFTVTDEEGQSKELTEDEITALKETAKTFAAEGKTAEDFKAYASEKGYEATTVTFDSESTSVNADLLAAAEGLKAGETTEAIESDSAVYVGRVTSLLDRTATDAKKESIVEERKSELYKTTVEKWVKDAGTKVDKGNWKKVDFQSLKVTIKQVEQTEEEAN